MLYLAHTTSNDGLGNESCHLAESTKIPLVSDPFGSLQLTKDALVRKPQHLEHQQEAQHTCHTRGFAMAEWGKQLFQSSDYMEMSRVNELGFISFEGSYCKSGLRFSSPPHEVRLDSLEQKGRPEAGLK